MQVDVKATHTYIYVRIKKQNKKIDGTQRPNTCDSGSFTPSVSGIEFQHPTVVVGGVRPALFC